MRTQMERAAELYLAPRQVSVGVSGGISVLYHGLRLLLEVHPDFLVVRIDLRNAYNESRRAQASQTNLKTNPTHRLKRGNAPPAPVGVFGHE